jgi:hypothetical protein
MKIGKGGKETNQEKKKPSYDIIFGLGQTGCLAMIPCFLPFELTWKVSYIWSTRYFFPSSFYWSRMAQQTCKQMTEGTNRKIKILFDFYPVQHPSQLQGTIRQSDATSCWYWLWCTVTEIRAVSQPIKQSSSRFTDWFIHPTGTSNIGGFIENFSSCWMYLQ